MKKMEEEFPYYCGDLRIKNGRCQILIQIKNEITKNGIKYVLTWEDYFKFMLKTWYLMRDAKQFDSLYDVVPNYLLPEDEEEIINE